MNEISRALARYRCARCGEEYFRTEREPKQYPVGGDFAHVCRGCWNLLTAPLEKRERSS